MGKKFNLTKLIGNIEDTREVQDPWGLGWSFTVRRAHNKGFIDWQKRQQIENPIYRKVMEGMAKAAVRQLGGVNASEEEVQARVIEEVANSLEVGENDFDKFFRSQAEGIAQHILVDWAGIHDEDGKAVPFSVEAALELLGEIELLPDEEDLYGAGGQVGAVLQGFLLNAAQETEAFRAHQVKEAEGNSESSSGSSSAGGTDQSSSEEQPSSE